MRPSRRERGRQNSHIELIASENFVSEAVLAAQGSVLTNKYAEGLPGPALLRRLRVRGHRRKTGHRAGQGAVRRRTRQRAAPFGRPGQSSRVFRRCSKPGDTVMGMNLPHGGHLTHGHPVNLSGKWLPVRTITASTERPSASTTTRSGAGQEVRPKMIVAGGKRLSARHRFRPAAGNVR